MQSMAICLSLVSLVRLLIKIFALISSFSHISGRFTWFKSTSIETSLYVECYKAVFNV